MRKTFVSQSGNIIVVISGARIIKSLSINDEYLLPENKALIEKELMETINRAMREMQEEIQSIVKNNEKELNNELK
jgi:DNA-binding protein YbaB